jgi:hypothetical protein
MVCFDVAFVLVLHFLCAHTAAFAILQSCDSITVILQHASPIPIRRSSQVSHPSAGVQCAHEKKALEAALAGLRTNKGTMMPLFNSQRTQVRLEVRARRTVISPGEQGRLWSAAEERSEGRELLGRGLGRSRPKQSEPVVEPRRSQFCREMTHSVSLTRIRLHRC